MNKKKSSQKVFLEVTAVWEAENKRDGLKDSISVRTAFPLFCGCHADHQEGQKWTTQGPTDQITLNHTSGRPKKQKQTQSKPKNKQKS